jgi:hypothetical protein
MNLRKSPIAARELGISYSRLCWLLRADKLTPPLKDSSGDYVWADKDVEAARRALAIDRRRKVVSTVQSADQSTEDVCTRNPFVLHAGTNG